MYAIELNGSHLGMPLHTIKKYKYKGENREKPTTYPNVQSIHHYLNSDKKTGYVTISYKKPNAYYSATIRLNFDQLIAVGDLDASDK